MRTTPNTADNVAHFLSALETPSRELTKWEQSFVESLTEQFAERGRVSDRQFEILEAIYTEKTP